MAAIIINFEELQETIENIARKYSRNTSISYEDFCQELWLVVMEKACDNIALIKTTLVNKAIDLSRSNWRHQYRNMDTDFTDPIVVNDTLPKMSASHETSNDNYLEIEIIDLLNELKEISENAYKYAISKAYLNGNLSFLKTQYNELYKELSYENRNLISSNKNKYTDDLILKVFCGIKTGTNSGSARTIKRLVKDLFTKI